MAEARGGCLISSSYTLLPEDARGRSFFLGGGMFIVLGAHQAIMFIFQLANLVLAFDQIFSADKDPLGAQGCAI